MAVLVPIGLNGEGFRAILGVVEDTESGRAFLRQMNEPGLRGVRLVISAKCLGWGSSFRQPSGSTASSTMPAN
jgi:transposase-like protein